MSEFRGRIHLREVDKKSLDLQIRSDESWVSELLEAAAPGSELTGLSAEEWADKSKYQGHARIEKVGSEYMVSGQFEAAVPAPCSRCGDLFEAERKGDFRVFLKLNEDEESFSDDPDYVFFDSQDINLVDLLSEQLIVQEPVAECPSQKADGSCHLCGKNPQYTARQGTQNEAMSALSTQLNRLKGSL